MTHRIGIQPEEVLAHTPWLRALARTLVGGDAALADDVVQSTWLAAFAAPPERGVSRPWLARSLKNIAHTLRRGDRRRDQREQAYADDEEPQLPSPDELSERLDIFRIVCEELGELQEPYRSTILLRYSEGLDARAIADRQGIPTGTVRWRAHHGLEKLRERLDARFGGNRETWIAGFMVLFPRSSRPAPIAAPGGLIPFVALPTALSLALAAVTLTLVSAGADSPGAAASLEPDGTVELSSRRPVTIAGRDESLRTAAHLAPETASTAEPVTRKLVIKITVLDREGDPIETARLTARRGEESRSADADANGRIALGLPPVWRGSEPIDLQATAEGHSTVTLSRPFDIDERSDDLVIDLAAVRLEPVGQMRGVVVDKTGRPISDAPVVVVAELPESERDVWDLFGPEPDMRRYSTVTDSDGSFVLDEVPTGTWRVGAGSRGSEWAWSLPIEIESGATESLPPLALQELPPERSLSGRVLDPAGLPVPFAELSVAYPGSDAPFPAKADLNGQFIVPSPDGRGGVVMARPPDGSFSPTVVPLEPGTQNTVQLEAPPELGLEVQDEGGEPVEIVRVEQSDGRHTWLDDAVDGRADLLLANVPTTIRISAPGFATTRLGSLEPGETRSIQLVPLSRITGRVTVDGEPAPGTRVRLVGRLPQDERLLIHGFPTDLDLQRTVEGETDASGFFSLPIEAAGEYVVLADRPGRSGTQVVAGILDPRVDARQDVALHATGRIEGRVLAPVGESPAGVLVLLSRGDGPPTVVRTDEHGAYHAEGLATGNWNVRATAPSASARGPEPGSHSQAIEVVEGGTVVRDVPLDAAAPAVAFASER